MKIKLLLKEALDILQEQHIKASRKYDKMWHSDPGGDWEGFLKKTAPIREKMSELSFKIKSGTKNNWEDIPEYGDLMTMKHWKNCVKSGGFIDYDGCGNYSDGERMSDKVVHPSELKKGRVLDGFSHVVWFNR